MKSRALAVTASIVCAALGAHGTDALAVTEAGAQLLTYPIHARLVAMGETGVADNSDPSTIYYNPANVIAPRRAYAEASRMRYKNDAFGADLRLARANAGYSWQTGGSLTLAADFTLAEFDYGESIATDPAGNPLGTFNAYERVASLALGIGMTSGDRFEFRFGGAVKRWWASYGPSDFTQDSEPYAFDAIAFDAGITATIRSDMTGWNVIPALGVALIDAGPDFEVVEGESDPLPMRLNFGASVLIESPPQRLWTAEIPVVAVTCNVDATEPKYGDFRWAIGSEVAIAQILFVRTGSHMIHRDTEEDTTYSAWGIGLGVPVYSLRVRFDYANSTYQNINDQMGLSLEWLF